MIKRLLLIVFSSNMNTYISPQGHYNILRDTVFTNESAISEEFLTSNTQQRNKFGVVRFSIGFILI